MNRLQFIHKQTQETRIFTKKLIEELPNELWYKTPEIINSNIAWQVGHLVVSQIYHSILVITGPNEKIAKQIPVNQYMPKYIMGSNPAQDNGIKPSPEELRFNLDFVNEIAMEELHKLTEDDLDGDLEPTKFPHPTAQTKFDALTWNFKHEMWHCGQISTIKRVIGQPTEWRYSKFTR